jgi:hypothetical protein
VEWGQASGAMPIQGFPSNGSLAPSWAALAGIFRWHRSTRSQLRVRCYRVLQRDET